MDTCDLRYLHWLHHVDPASNLGISECFVDAACGTLLRARWLQPLRR